MEIKYSDIYSVFIGWHRQGKLGLPKAVEDEVKINPIDLHICQCFKLPVTPNIGDQWHEWDKELQNVVNSTDFSWLYSPHAYTIYKAKLASKA